MDKNTALKQYFGHDSFREGQEKLIDSILSGRDVLGIMPTGGGKSLCYQVPALLCEGTALVISPLISLMKDQVMELTSAGVKTAFINSSLSSEQLRTVYGRMAAGAYKLVYVAPERLDSNVFASIAASLDISLVAVDEAHCISQWGQDFRPSYMKIADFLERLPQRPVLGAFTATATEAVRQDILRILGLRDPFCLVTGFDRPNLYFDVQKPQKKPEALRNLVLKRKGKSGIVYCSTRSAVEKVCEDLRSHGVSASRYHAGLSDEERRQNQEDFRYDRVNVMVATNAFGMGIDKSNVSFVIHYNMPKSLEAYYQEAGRAGRDGEKADCILLYSARDVTTARFLIENGHDNDALDPQQQALVIKQNYKLLDSMVGYCKTQKCLRSYILDYFGQAHDESCGNCGNCLSPVSLREITREAQMILSCVKRVHDKLGYSVGQSLIANVLHGSVSQRVLSLGLNTLSTYALMRDVKRKQIQSYIEFLEASGYLHADPVHRGLTLTSAASGVLFRGDTVQMPVRLSVPKYTGKAAPQREKPLPASPSPEPTEAEAAPSPYDMGLYERLRKLRARFARKENVPPYIVFSNAALADMALKRPQTLEEFLEVNGVGKHKAAHYGEAFLDEIAKYEDYGDEFEEDE